MTVEFDDMVDAIVTIGNHSKIKEICEPNVMEPLKLEAWMVARTLVAWGLLFEESKKKK